MKRTFLFLLPICLFAQPGGIRSLSPAELRDKIAGGWAGQMIGVAYGEPTEFRYNEKIIPKEKLPVWSPDKVSRSLNQDDLYVDMTFAQVLDDKGLDATTEDFGAMFKDARYALWHANLAARRALKRGVPARLTGTPQYNAHANDIDFQIEADFIGLMAPGLPRSATQIAWRAGRVMNYGDGLYGGVFVSCMYAAAFFENDPHRIVDAGIACLPAASPYAKFMRDVVAWHKDSPSDWEAAWKKIEAKWNRCEACPEGARVPFNIDAHLNGAYIVLGLLYGDGSMSKTIEISTRAGQDSDCNPSSAAGILGVMLGYQRLPDDWKSGIPAMANEKFRYTNYTYNTIVDSTYNRAVALIKRTGGSVSSGSIRVKTEKPAPAPLEVWNDYGCPEERIPAADARWKFTGNWAAAPRNSGRLTTEAGAEASIEFEGSGFILSGPFHGAAGKADVYLDGKLEATIDAYPDEDSWKSNESLLHRFKLKPGKHSVRLVARGETYPGSKGKDIIVTSLVVFR